MKRENEKQKHIEKRNRGKREINKQRKQTTLGRELIKREIRNGSEK
jgi:hypothetical protein